MNNFPAYFHKIYCINLDRRPDRWKEAQQEFMREGILHGVHRFPAIDGNTVKANSPDVSPGNAGCTASHAAILRDIIHNRYERSLIFEDDVNLIHKFSDRFFELLPQVPADWQVLYLGANHMELPIRMAPNVGHVQFAYTTHAYCVTLEGAKALLAEAEKIDAAIDSAYTRLQKTIPCYALYPNLAWQRPSYSDILERDADYSFMKPFIK